MSLTPVDLLQSNMPERDIYFQTESDESNDSVVDSPIVDFEEDLDSGPKLRLLRLNGTPTSLVGYVPAVSEQIIKQNLEPLKQNTKKKTAQTLYYKKYPEHQSPLTKEERGPVHQRLGVKQIRLKRSVPLGTNTASILPKRKTFRPLNANNNNSVRNTLGQMRQQKLHRLYSAQSRLERIRSHQGSNCSTIKLKRLSFGLPPATNLTVQVNNPNFIPGANGSTYSLNNELVKFKMNLNQEIQEEIAEIQRENGGIIIPLPPLTRVSTATTGIPTSTRFALL